METTKAITLLKKTLSEIAEPSGSASTERFSSLREVDGKVRETKMLFSGVSGLPESFLSEMKTDEDFQANSRRVRLEALAGYIRSSLKFLEAGGITKPKKQVFPPPEMSKLVSVMPGLQKVIDRRWREAQKCQYVEAYTAAVILMGSTLEALLLCRVSLSSLEASQSPKAPKNKNGKTPAIQDWNLNTLIEVSVERGWLKSDRGKFSHALRQSRNVVHPWEEVATKADFDAATCRTSWEVLKASVDDLLNSI